ncbi:MAG: DsrE/DsrF/DrsH-like family protein [Candidatus Heimdallarchaeota archaeon]|nr:DsrE/DsrF/DrsH-like family protein [Candidatus Heimdallarchaeota archaeon]
MGQKILIMVSFGEDYPDRLEPPLHLAGLGAALDTEVIMVYTMSGGLLLKKGNAERIVPMAGKKTYIESVREVKEFGVKIYVCSPTLERYGLTRKDFIDEVDDIVGGMYFVTEALEADVTFTF